MLSWGRTLVGCRKNSPTRRRAILFLAIFFTGGSRADWSVSQRHNRNGLQGATEVCEFRSVDSIRFMLCFPEVALWLAVVKTRPLGAARFYFWLFFFTGGSRADWSVRQCRPRFYLFIVNLFLIRTRVLMTTLILTQFLLNILYSMLVFPLKITVLKRDVRVSSEKL